MDEARPKVAIRPELRPAVAVAAAARNLARHLYGPRRPRLGHALRRPRGDGRPGRTPPRLRDPLPRPQGAGRTPRAARPRTPAPPAPGISARKAPRPAASTREPGWPSGRSPPGTAPAAGGPFSPQSKALGIDLTGHSPAAQRKIVYAGVVASSHALASQMLKGLAELELRQGEVGLPEEGESETGVRSVMARTLGYLKNHQDKTR